MWQEQEKMRSQLEQRTLNPAEMKKVSELGQEIHNKQYYYKKIEYLEGEYKC
jgi:hypothetical protein